MLDNKGKCQAFIWVNCSNSTAQSPVKAPFGGFEVISSVPVESIYQLISFTENHIMQCGVTSFEIRMPPLAYSQESYTLLNTFLLNRGFHISNAEISSIITVSRRPFESIITSWELRKLNQCRKAGLTFHKLKTTQLSIIYHFIQDCRQQKGYSLSMSCEEIVALSQTFPKNLKLYSVQQNNTIAAACIAILVNKKILYTFYYDHSKNFQHVSPVVLLVDGIYKDSKRQGIELIDLGTSSVNGQPNFPLLNFKLQLGALPSMKFSFYKNLVQ
jgi:hypothetical protein